MSELVSMCVCVCVCVFDFYEPPTLSNEHKYRRLRQNTEEDIYTNKYIHAPSEHYTNTKYKQSVIVHYPYVSSLNINKA